MSFEDIAKFKEQVALKNVRQVTKGNLILFNYTDQCTYAKAWDTEYTRNARGIIYDQITGELIAKPFPKFFNLGEMPETYLNALPIDQDYEVFEKMDGSLGIIYYYSSEWHVATRGSFDSEQAQKAKYMLSKYDMSEADIDCTFLVEIIYPENKIVVNYGAEEKLVLLGAYRCASGREFSREMIESAAINMRMPLARTHQYTIAEMIELQATMPKDQEGFVVRFANGLRIKIKGAEYLKIHKMISNMSPLSFWESMDKGVVNKDYLAQLPEEFRSTYEPMVAQLESQYMTTKTDIILDSKKLPTNDWATKEGLKTIGLFCQGENNLSHPGAVFPYILGKEEALNKYIMKFIRPHGNILE